jgi:hypothetical protein
MKLADVHAALAYDWDNDVEIDQQMKEADEFVEQLKAAHDRGPLARKLAALESGRDQVSPRREQQNGRGSVVEKTSVAFDSPQQLDLSRLIARLIAPRKK